MSAVSKKIVFIAIIAAFLMMSMGGVFSAEMMMADGSMANCPFMSVTALCDMSPLAHLTKWQQLFSITAQLSATILLLTLLLYAAAGYFWRRRLIPRHTEAIRPRNREAALISDTLRSALARGRLQSKAF